MCTCCQILYQRGNLGDRVLKVLNAQPSCIKDCLVPGMEAPPPYLEVQGSCVRFRVLRCIEDTQNAG